MTQDESNRWREAVRSMLANFDSLQDESFWDEWGDESYVPRIKQEIMDILARHGLSLEEKKECQHKFNPYKQGMKMCSICHEVKP